MYKVQLTSLAFADIFVRGGRETSPKKDLPIKKFPRREKGFHEEKRATTWKKRHKEKKAPHIEKKIKGGGGGWGLLISPSAGAYDDTRTHHYLKPF